MDKVQKLNNPNCYTTPSEHYIIQNLKCHKFQQSISMLIMFIYRQFLIDEGKSMTAKSTFLLAYLLEV
jgi:hypothetical protein